MSRYEQRLDHDLNVIRERMQSLSSVAKQSLEKALHSLLSGNRKLAYATILGDAWVNKRARELDALCHRFIARHLPSAGHLRFMSAVIRTSLQLERLGDYAVTIAREGVQLSAPPQGPTARQLEVMAEQANTMLGNAIDAFNEGNEGKARASMALGESMEGTMDGIYSDLMTASNAARIKDLLALFVVFNMVKRISDQAKNICEETLFFVSGETKHARVHDVVFVDQNNACLSQMALAIARRSFPGNARFASAGRSPAGAIDAGMKTFMENLGFDLSGARPASLDDSPGALSKYFVIVSLDGVMERYATQIPFHTSVLEWDVGTKPEGLEGDALKGRHEELYRELSSNVQSLVEALRGD